MVPRRNRLSRLTLPAVLGLLLTSCAIMEIEDAPLSAVEPRGPFARQINDLFWPVFWVAVGVFALVQGAILVAVIFFRDREGAGEARQLHGSPKLEILWTIIPALILAGVAVPTVRGVFDLTDCATDAMDVEVIAHQWWFEYYYPEADVYTANVMVIPAGQEVCAQVTSDDVIHSFWIPALNGKRYATPGYVSELRLQADEPGEYAGHCAEFCGLSHSLMRARVLALEPGEFDQWLADQQRPATLPAEGTPEYEGYEVFLSKACTQCHQVRFDDEEASNLIQRDLFNGPELTHFASRNVFAGAILPGDGEDRTAELKRWLADPPSVKPGTFMPDLALTEQEIDALIVWLESNE